MNTALLLVGTGSGLSHSLYSAVSKLLLNRRISHPFLFLLYINALQAIITPVVWCFWRPVLPPLSGWGHILAAAATCTAAYFFLYMAFSSGDVSSVMPMMGSKVIFSGLLARVMMGESHSGSIYIAAVLVAVAVGALSYSPSKGRPGGVALKPMGLMLACCVVFGLTDIYIKRSLRYVDPYSFMVYYNALVAVGSLIAIPFLWKQGVSLRVERHSLLITLLAAAFLVAATLMFVVSFELAGGVVVPNILMSTRGVFIVLISAWMSSRSHMALDRQSRRIYLLRFAASVLIVFSVWLALR
ncbi:MAG TPA: EamA family transporter [Phycisphaerae bacterium]|nr:EamA family transporter [Phycisphaerae bacterium]